MEQILEKLIQEGALDTTDENDLYQAFKNTDIDSQIEALDLLMDLGYIQYAARLSQGIQTFENSEMNYTLAELAFLQGDMDGAILHTSNIDKESDIYVKGLLLEAEVYASLDLPDVSEKKLKEMRHYVEDGSLADLFLAEFYYDQENYEQAYQLYAKLIEDPEYGDKVDSAKFASLSYALGEYETALLFFKKIIHPETLNELQIIEYSDLLMNSDDIAGAISLLQHVVQEKPYTVPNVRVRLAQLLIYNEEMDQAKQCIQDGLEHDGENAQLLLFDALIAKKENNMYRFEQQLYKVLLNHPENIGALRELVEYKFKQEAYGDIEQLLTQLENQGEYDIVYGWYRARILNTQGHVRESFKQYQSLFEDLQMNMQFVNEYAILANELNEMEILRDIVVFSIERNIEIEHISLYREILSID